MATWQHDLYAVPRRHFGTAAWVLDFAPSDDDWRSWSGEVALLHHLDRDFVKREHWSSATSAWGDTDGTCIELSRHAGMIDSLRIRVDARRASMHEVILIANIAAAHDLVFIEFSGRVLQANAASLARSLAESPAAEFVADPELFLAKLEPDPEQSE